jgi:hypothetical protein
VGGGLNLRLILVVSFAFTTPGSRRLGLAAFSISGQPSAAEQYQAILAGRRAARLAELEELRRKEAREKASGTRTEEEPPLNHEKNPADTSRQNPAPESEPGTKAEPEEESLPQGSLGRHFA